MQLWESKQKEKDLWWERGKGEKSLSFFQKLIFQANVYPWIAALLRDEDTDVDYINSNCAAVLVSTLSMISSFFIHKHNHLPSPPDWQQICPDSGSLLVRRRQRGVAARQLLLHHARPPRQEEGQGAKQVAVTTYDQGSYQPVIN